jgi:hypothetical protein
VLRCDGHEEGMDSGNMEGLGPDAELVGVGETTLVEHENCQLEKSR